MSDYVAMLMVQAQVVMVRVYGMQAENAFRMVTDNTVSYSEDAFLACQEELESIANAINQAR